LEAQHVREVLHQEKAHGEDAPSAGVGSDVEEARAIEVAVEEHPSYIHPAPFQAEHSNFKNRVLL